MATVTATVTAMAMRRNTRGFLFPLGVSLGLAALPAVAGEWTITPSISLQETATDNVKLDRNRKSDLITDISPGIKIDGRGGRVNLRFDYRMHNLFYANDSSRSNIQNSLNALGTIEALENWFFIEASGSISQQSVSAFGGATNSSVNTNSGSNTTETSTYRLSPYFRGTLGSFADYQLRYNLSTSSSKAGGTYDTDTREIVGRLAGLTTYARLGWALDASSQEVEYGNGRKSEADRLRGVLTYHYDPQFRMLLIGGREANDYLSLDKESHTIKGVGFEWAPTERTKISASRESRFFGDSNSISFSHRTGGTAWKYSQSKDATSSPNQQSGVGLGTYYDLFFNMFASAIPDPNARAAYVNALLLSSGISPAAQLQGGFLTSGVTLQQRRELSFALLGVRNTVTFAATQSESQNLSQGAGTGLLIGTDFANVQNIRQRGLSVNWSHNLTGLSTLAGGISKLKSKGSGGNELETDQTMYTLNFLTKLGPKTSAGLGARRVVVDGSTSYTENALTGSLSHQF